MLVKASGHTYNTSRQNLSWNRPAMFEPDLLLKLKMTAQNAGSTAAAW